MLHSGEVKGSFCGNLKSLISRNQQLGFVSHGWFSLNCMSTCGGDAMSPWNVKTSQKKFSIDSVPGVLFCAQSEDRVDVAPDLRRLASCQCSKSNPRLPNPVQPVACTASISRTLSTLWHQLCPGAEVSSPKEATGALRTACMLEQACDVWQKDH